MTFGLRVLLCSYRFWYSVTPVLWIRPPHECGLRPSAMIESCTVMFVLSLIEKFSSRPHDTERWSKTWLEPWYMVTASCLGPISPCRNRMYRTITFVEPENDTW